MSDDDLTLNLFLESRASVSNLVCYRYTNTFWKLKFFCEIATHCHGAAPWSSLEKMRIETLNRDAELRKKMEAGEIKKEYMGKRKKNGWPSFTLDDLVKKVNPCAGERAKGILRYDDYTMFDEGAKVLVSIRWGCDLDSATPCQPVWDLQRIDCSPQDEQTMGVSLNKITYNDALRTSRNKMKRYGMRIIFATQGMF